MEMSVNVAEPDMSTGSQTQSYSNALT